ncbi:MAG: serine hydrolase [Anaerolineaceae bacterium]|nr:serine hydrolase [Anaerolineaceae bacterium]
MFTKQLAELIQQKANAGEFSGVVALWQADEPVFQQAVGLAHRGFGIANTLETRFRLASIGKLFTAVATLQLIEQNQFKLDTPIHDLLNLSHTTIPANVTIFHLLTMSSGIADWFEESEDWEAEWAALCRENPIYLLRQNADYLPLFSQKPPNFAAGERYQYNNAGYILLGLAIEAVSSVSYFDYVRQHVFARAGMVGADFIALDAIAPNLAEGYVAANNQSGQTTWRKNIYSTTPEAAADGGAVATAVDLHRFSEALRNGRLLPPEKTETMLYPYIPESDEPINDYFWQYGFGNEFVFDRRHQLLRWGHTGEEDGVSGRFYHYPAQTLDVVILGNQSWCAGGLGWQVHDLIIKQTAG